MCFFCMSSEKPTHVAAKGAKGGLYAAMLDKDKYQQDFAVGLKNACCTEPLCCCISTCCAPWGCTACCVGAG